MADTLLENVPDARPAAAIPDPNKKRRVTFKKGPKLAVEVEENNSLAQKGCEDSTDVPPSQPDDVLHEPPDRAWCLGYSEGKAKLGLQEGMPIVQG